MLSRRQVEQLNLLTEDIWDRLLMFVSARGVVRQGREEEARLLGS